ncbi:MAG: Mur ligase family protein [Patescibacteria group bacterium]
MYSIVSFLAKILKKVMPEWLVHMLRAPYHQALSLFAYHYYGTPTKHLTVIGVTGTKGKSTVADMLYVVFTHAGYKTALASTIRFATPSGEEPNRFKMTMQGRGFLHFFLARAKREGATHAIVEITSEGTLDERHRYLNLDGLIVTNIQREHLERHGSFENYVAAKRAIVHELERSPKKHRVLVANASDENVRIFFENAQVPTRISFRDEEASGMPALTPLSGTFNNLNALATLKMVEAFGVPHEAALQALKTLPQVRGRVEPIEAGQPFKVIVDYAHTPDSLEALYSAYPQRKICVLGNTGGGRDTWKRPLMGKIADEHCDTVILTNEDPYDEDPEKIVNDMTTEMKRTPTIVMDRREAIHHALTLAKANDAVLISGKGTDPYIMEAGGKKTPWDDATVVREELAALGFN